ncbi:MAG: biotin/lipoyl-containing protein, partial [Vicinamibacterales bacterium]
VSRVVLGEARHAEARARYQAAIERPAAAAVRPGALDDLRAGVAEALRREPTTDELYSHLMYPTVHTAFVKHQREFGDVSVLPTPAFFYGLAPGEEIHAEIEEGKTLIIRLVSVGAPDKDSRRTVRFELNGMARDTLIVDRGVAPKAKPRPKANLADANDVAAPIPGLIATLSASVGARVARGEKLLMMEAMKMQTTVYAPCDGVVAELHVALGDTVEAKDLLVRMRPAE